jgi:membrane-bound metal-dependent hydrolase YbcI (DUF457 family)
MIGASMPSPIGHALAGVIVAWSADLISPQDRDRTGHEEKLTWLCAGLGAAPDLDLIVPGTHRMATHSLTAAFMVGAIAALVAARGGRPVVRLALICAAAYGSHLLLDWLGVDNYPPRGIQLLWPISQEWYISGLDVFRQTNRLHIFTRGPMMTNIKAITQEIAILGPIVAVLWRVRLRALAIT